VGIVLATASWARATTEINVPPDPAPSSIEGPVILNLFDTGVLPPNFTASNGAALNVFGGMVGDEMLARDAIVKVFSGELGNNISIESGTFEMTGGRVAGIGFSGNVSTVLGAAIGHVHAFGAHELNITGEANIPVLFMHSSIANVSGGTVGNVDMVFASSLNITGGTLEGINAEEASSVIIEGGVVSGSIRSDLGASILMTGGEITGQVSLDFESRIDVSGGTIRGGIKVFDGSAHVRGGRVGDNTAVVSFGKVDIFGGIVGNHFRAGQFDIFSGGGQVNLSGGAVGDDFDVLQTARITISGFDFQINGVPVAGLDAVGSSMPLDVPAGSLVSGVLADGTPFAFHSTDGDHFEPGSLTLSRSEVAAPGPAMIHLPVDDAPLGIRAGQLLVVDMDGALPAHFNAGAGAKLSVVGGAAGENLEAVGAKVAVSGGSVGQQFDAFDGSLVVFAGGSIGDAFHAFAGSSVQLFGSEFMIDGLSVPGLQNPGDSVVVDLRDGAQLTGRLLDGSMIDFDLNSVFNVDADYFDPAATVQLALAPPLDCRATPTGTGAWTCTI
jgi:hypothetical protein